MEKEIDITYEVKEYLELKYAAEAADEFGNSEAAGKASMQQNQLHHKLASYIWFYNEKPELARKVMSDFFKKATRFYEYIPERRKPGEPRVQRTIDNEKANLRPHFIIYNNPENHSVKIVIESVIGEPMDQIEFEIDGDKLSNTSEGKVQVTIPLDTFRDANQDRSTMPKSLRAERIIKGYGLIPAYWTSGYSHATSWFMDGITPEMAEQLIKDGPGNHQGGKYAYIMYDLKEGVLNDELSLILEINKKLNLL